MRSLIISLSLVTIIGVVIGLLLQSPELQSPEPVTDTSQTPVQGTLQSSTTETLIPEIRVLAQQLQQEILARQALQKEVTALSKKILALSGADTQTTHKDESTAIKKPTSAAAPAGNTWFNQQALIDAGMGPTAAQQLKTQFEELELAKLYLRDQAIREGWAQGKRYRDERLKLDSQTDNIKQEFGEDIYDAYLYASGQSNRVAVQSVLSGSAASNAGLLADDQVIRYSGQRIYNWRDLRNATTEGDLTDTVAIEILRDDKRLEFYVQRGPLGIRMTSVSEAP